MYLDKKCPFLKLFKTLLMMKRSYLLVYLFISYTTQHDTEHFTLMTPIKVEEGFNTSFDDVSASQEFMRYCDTDAPIYDHDEFMNRIVSISIKDHRFEGELRKHQILVPGIFINRDHILTSYVPFKYLRDNGVTNLDKMYFQFNAYKWFDEATGEQKGYQVNRGKLLCGRRVWENMTLRDKEPYPMPFDLMVFKTYDYLFYGAGLAGRNYYELYKNISITEIGPEVTKLANERDTIGEKFKFVSLGMLDPDHIFDRNHLHTVEMDKADGVIVNCEEWLPIIFNPLICILNVENHMTIGSGAFLISKERVFGVGSFTLFKDEKSIHVFTDVRAIKGWIAVTCSYWDGWGDNRFAFYPNLTGILPGAPD